MNNDETKLALFEEKEIRRNGRMGTNRPYPSI